MSLKPVIRSLTESLDGVPVHVSQLAELLRKHGRKQETNRDGVTDIDTFGHDVTAHGGNTKTTLWDPDTTYPIAEHGRITEIPEKTPRGDNATAIGHRGDEGDHGGHLGAHRFFGDTPDSGIVPQAANLNLGAWKTMENEWGDWVSEGHVIDYEIAIDPPGSIRPDGFDVSYSVTDSQGAEILSRGASFGNEPGQVFDRVPRNEMRNSGG